MLCIKQVEEFFERDIFSEKIYFDLLNTHFFVDCFVALASIAPRKDINKLDGFAELLKTISDREHSHIQRVHDASLLRVYVICFTYCADNNIRRAPSPFK